MIAVGEVLDERGWSIPGSGEQLRSFFNSLTNNPRFTVSRLPAGMIPSDIVVIGRVVANGIRHYAGKLEVELILEARFQHSGRIVKSQGFGKKNVPSNASAQRYIAEAVRRAIENAGPRLYVEIESSPRLEYGPPPYNFAYYGQAGEIYTRASIQNAFRMRAELSAHRNDGEAILGVYQRRRPTSGYRLAFLPGRIEIRAVSRRGTRVVEFAAAPFNLADGRRHNIEWRRGKRGDMSVRVDGQRVLQTRDRGFRDSFDGFTYATKRGDFALRSVRIDVKGRDDH